MNKYFLLPIALFAISCASSLNTSDTKTFKGVYSQVDGFAIFTDCQTNKSYPIAFEKDYVSLKKAYTVVANSIEDTIVVSFDANVEIRKSTQDSDKEFLIVERFENIWPKIDCNGNLGIANLKNSLWVLREFMGSSEMELKSKQDIHIIISTNNRVKGFGGCNNFEGNASIENDKINFTNINSNSKECNNSSAEYELLKTLGIVDKYKIYGEYLYLFSENKKLLVFESVYIN